MENNWISTFDDGYGSLEGDAFDDLLMKCWLDGFVGVDKNNGETKVDLDFDDLSLPSLKVEEDEHVDDDVVGGINGSIRDSKDDIEQQLLGGLERCENRNNCSCEHDKYGCSFMTTLGGDGGVDGLSSSTSTMAIIRHPSKEDETNVNEGQLCLLPSRPTPEATQSMMCETLKLPTVETTNTAHKKRKNNEVDTKKTKQKKIKITKTMSALPNSKKYVSKIGKHDVLFGKGGGEFGNHHPNKQSYLELIKSYQPRYKNEDASKQERKQIVDEIMEYIQQVQGGKFIKYDVNVRKWYIVTNQEARSKVTQCLRDNHDPLARKSKREKYAKPKKLVPSSS